MSSQLGFFDAPPRSVPPAPVRELPRGSGLRWYQTEAESRILASLREYRSTLLVMATGLGKTRSFSHIASCWPYDFNASPNVLVLAHRDELVRQAADALAVATGESVGVEKANERSVPSQRLVVGSIQSMNQARLDRLGKGRFGLVIADECFPAGTLVDGRPIESLRPGDLVAGLNHLDGSLSMRSVVRVMERHCKSPLMVIRSGATTLRCTANHPVFVKGKGYVPSERVLPGDLLCLWQPIHGQETDLQSPQENVLPCVQSGEVIGDHVGHESRSRERAHVCQQPNEEPVVTGQTERHTEGDGAQAPCSGREWSWTYHASVRAAGDPWETLGGGARGQNRAVSRVGLSHFVQAGPGAPGPEVWSGARRAESWFSGAPASGHEEGFVLAWSRVDSAEAEEQIFAGTVYNLEVAGAHTYFANGILVHNCHHFTASTYRRAFEFFDAKRLGVTATPDRADEVALGMILEDVAFTYDIGDGIADGFLVPLVGQSVQLDEIDISGVQDSAGDLSAGQLDDAMFKAVNGIVARSRELEPDRPALYFWPGVRCAEAAAARANALRPGSAEWVAGELRADGADCPVKNAIRRFRNGELKELHNCQVLTEGFDAPPTSLIVLGRPTKSRALIVQKIGRGLRSLPGVIDAFPDKRQECERRAAIANSAKPNAVVLDFVGNAGKHTLVDPVDALAGNHTDEEVEEVKKLIKKGNAADIREALKEAREKLARAAMAAKVRVKSRETQWDPFKILDVDLGDSERYTRRFGFKPPSERQADALKKFGIDDKELEGLSRSAASKLLDSLFKRKADGLASLKQVKQLKKYGIVETAVKADRAKEAMAYLNEQGWGRYGKIDPAKLTEIVYGTRQPGED